MPTDPTVAEIVRRLDEVTRSVERVASTLEASYVRKEVYEAKHEALRAYMDREFIDVRSDITRIESDRATDKGFRRQIVAGASVGLILILINLALAMSNFVARGGA